MYNANKIKFKIYSYLFYFKQKKNYTNDHKNIKLHTNIQTIEHNTDDSQLYLIPLLNKLIIKYTHLSPLSDLATYLSL